MSLDERLICALSSQWRSVDSLSVELGEEYSTVFFRLERLRNNGFVLEDEEHGFALAPLGEKIKKMLSSR